MVLADNIFVILVLAALSLFFKFKCGLSRARLNYAKFRFGGSKYSDSLIALAGDRKFDNGPVFSRRWFRGRFIPELFPF